MVYGYERGVNLQQFLINPNTFLRGDTHGGLPILKLCQAELDNGCIIFVSYGCEPYSDGLGVPPLVEL